MKNRALQMLASEVWAIHPPKLQQMMAFLESRQKIVIRAGKEAKKNNTSIAPAEGSIAVMPIFGVIARRMSMMDEMCDGGTSLARLSNQFEKAMNDKTISTIVLIVDSPGGTVGGVQEFGDKVFAARGKKQVIAVADTLAASAAYWISSAAEQLYCSPSGFVGSIGVITMHEDWSGALDKAGVKTTLFTAGKYKGEGNFTEPMTDEGKRYLQSILDDLYTDFVDAIARNRDVESKKVISDYGEGRVLNAKNAMNVGMIDGIKSLDDVLNELMKVEAPRKAIINAVEQRKQRIETLRGGLNTKGKV